MTLAATRRGVHGTIIVGAVLGMVGWGSGAAAEYPEKPINVIVAWGAGGATDVVTRALQPTLAEQLGARSRHPQCHRCSRDHRHGRGRGRRCGWLHRSA